VFLSSGGGLWTRQSHKFLDADMYYTHTHTHLNCGYINISIYLNIAPIEERRKNIYIITNSHVFGDVASAWIVKYFERRKSISGLPFSGRLFRAVIHVHYHYYYYSFRKEGRHRPMIITPQIKTFLIVFVYLRYNNNNNNNKSFAVGFEIILYLIRNRTDIIFQQTRFYCLNENRPEVCDKYTASHAKS